MADAVHVASGKVRELYELDQDRLLLVASDRISTFDVVLPTAIPDKGRVLTGLAAFFRTGRQARQGCLMINSIAEDEGRGTRLGHRAQAFRDRLTAAIANAMASQHEPGLVSERAQLLTATTFGIWLAARIDPAGAAQACEAAAASIRGWQQAPAGPGRSS